MTEDPTLKVMSAVFPEATRKLLQTIKVTTARATSGDAKLHESEAYVLTNLVEPMLEALGFDPSRQRMEFRPFEHLILTMDGRDMVMLILKELNQSQDGMCI